MPNNQERKEQSLRHVPSMQRKTSCLPYLLSPPPPPLPWFFKVHLRHPCLPFTPMQILYCNQTRMPSHSAGYKSNNLNPTRITVKLFMCCFKKKKSLSLFILWFLFRGQDWLFLICTPCNGLCTLQIIIILLFSAKKKKQTKQQQKKITQQCFCKQVQSD